ncbi:MAG: hypothetical protein FWG90_09515 [Oscillospiraceae bacterium]|nr:hypothetical protein [Oscillospiraceae bacterium]
MGSNFKIFLAAGGLAIFFTALFVFGGLQSYRDYYLELPFDPQIGMSSRQRERDFKELCKRLEQNVVFLYDYQERYNLRYETTKQVYTSLVKNAQTDLEYITLVSGFLNNIPIPSAGVDIRIYNNPESGNPRQFYWAELLNEVNSGDYKRLTFEYADGDYIRSSYLSDWEIQGGEYARLISVDGAPVDSFTLMRPMPKKLKYDHINEKHMRDSIIFNSGFGTECVIEYETADGIIMSETVCYSGAYGLYEEAVTVHYAALSYDYSDDTPEDDTRTLLTKDDLTADTLELGDLSIYKDRERNTVYLRTGDMNWSNYRYDADYDRTHSGEQSPWDVIATGALELDNIIIDLRGLNDMSMAFNGYSFLSRLFTVNVTDQQTTYALRVPRGAMDGGGFKRLNRYNFGSNIVFHSHDYSSNIIFDSWANMNKLYFQDYSWEIGARADKYIVVYILVSDKTESWAENFARIAGGTRGTRGGFFPFYSDEKIQQVNIIGNNNTSGKGWGGDYGQLKRSGISLEESFSSNGYSYGIPPDIYVPFTREAYIATDSARGETIGYQDRLEWDDALLKALELIEQRGQGE